MEQIPIPIFPWQKSRYGASEVLPTFSLKGMEVNHGQAGPRLPSPKIQVGGMKTFKNTVKMGGVGPAASHPPESKLHTLGGKVCFGV